MRLGSTLLCRLLRSTSSHHRPWQIAMAVTVGVLLGILPKTSLLFVLLGLVCIIVPAHLPILGLTTLLVALASPLLEPILGSVGLWSLTNPRLAPYWLRIDGLPLVPWLAIHNTIINGCLFAWVVSSLPIYLCSRLFTGLLFSVAIPDEVADIMLTAEARLPLDAMRGELEIRPLAGLQEPGVVRTPIAPPVVIWDDINHDASYFDLDAETGLDPTTTGSATTEQIIQRSAEIAAWAEELITEELLMDDRSGSPVPSEMQNTNASATYVNVDDEERWLIETTMEMVRIAEQAVTNQAAMKAKHTADLHDPTHAQSSIQEISEIQIVQPQNTSLAGREADLPASSIRREQMPHSDHRSHLGPSRTSAPDSAINGAVNQPREEALHYLLRHLKGVQEKAQKQ
jgi:uncharacterized protein (TIGR03546 family)